MAVEKHYVFLISSAQEASTYLYFISQAVRTFHGSQYFFASVISLVPNQLSNKQTQTHHHFFFFFVFLFIPYKTKRYLTIITPEFFLIRDLFLLSSFSFSIISTNSFLSFFPSLLVGCLCSEGTSGFCRITCSSSNGREPESADNGVKSVERLVEEKKRAELSARIASGEFTVKQSGYAYL